ncbi:MAG: SusC/RagA family TonB-linked outer membrane protein [Bacteroides intestinalis]|nr:SusC/RagA family TonB-linked outer membrane protein [Bacteroides intestinalis]
MKNWLVHTHLNYRINSANRHWDYQKLYNYDINGGQYDRTSDSHVHEDYYKDNYLDFKVYTEYSRTFAQKHNFHVMGGLQAEELKETKFGLQRDGIIDVLKPEVDLTSGLNYKGEPVTPGVNGSRNDWAVLGLYGRINYDYDGKYLFEANIRKDGSSRFRKHNRWKSFPSVSVGWNVAQESFFEPLRDKIDMLKLRASYGSLGNQNTTNWYQTYQRIEMNPSSGGWLMGNVKPNTAKMPGLVSESLTWETIETYNIGLDWSVLRNRFTGSFNWHTRNTKDMVGSAPRLPDVLGTDVPKPNNTDLRTQGWEFIIGWRDVLKNGLSYGAKFTLYDSRTKITRYPLNPTNSYNKYVEGRYINEIWGLVTKGIAKTDEEMQQHLASLPEGGQSAIGSAWAAGDIMYADLNGDGKISRGSETVGDPGDMKVIGNSTPRFQFSLDLNAAWKGFDVRVFFQGVMKRDVWQGSNYLFGAGNGSAEWSAFGITSVSDYFRDENTWSVKEGYRTANTDAYLPRSLYNTKNMQKQTGYLQNAAYIRLKNLQIGYTLPTQLTGKWKIQRARIFFSGENLLTGTSLVEQFDPETIVANNGNAYPLSKTLSFGLSLTF